jgi:hypothetical protein
MHRHSGGVSAPISAQEKSKKKQKSKRNVTEAVREEDALIDSVHSHVASAVNKHKKPAKPLKRSSAKSDDDKPAHVMTKPRSSPTRLMTVLLTRPVVEGFLAKSGRGRR